MYQPFEDKFFAVLAPISHPAAIHMATLFLVTGSHYMFPIYKYKEMFIFSYIY